MKKLFLSLVAAIVAATASYAQNTLVATLSHGEDITMFYGTNALKNAMNAAQSGDVINLSGGGFQATNITKAVTLRGTGIDVAAPTYINGDFTINIPSDDTNRLSMEGVRCTGSITMKGTFNNPYFVKSHFYNFYYNDNPIIKNAMFANCRITNKYLLNGASTVQFINSYVSGFTNGDQTNTAASFINCLIKPQSYYLNAYSQYRPENIINSQLLNCIIFTDSSFPQSNQLPASSIATNCVSITFDNLFGTQTANTCNSTATFAQLFKDFTGAYSDSQTFELTDEASATYLGNDGTEVGLYGGMLPYTSTPSYPQITKMNVANKATADGKLSVEIEVSAAE